MIPGQHLFRTALYPDTGGPAHVHLHVVEVAVAATGELHSRRAMIDEILAGLFGEAVFGRLGHSRRAQLLFRLFFGLLGAALGVAGAILFARDQGVAAIRPMQIAMIVTFSALAAFCLFNVALGRKWRWPGQLFVVSFIAIFVTRLAFGP